MAVKNVGTATDDDVTGLKVLLYRDGDTPHATTVSCGDGNVTAAANTSSATALTCDATYDLDATDQTAKTVSLLATVLGSNLENGTSTPATDVALKGSLTVQPATLAVSGTAVTTQNPASTGNAVTITFTFRNTGPINVTGITVAAPDPSATGVGAVTSCAAVTAVAPGPAVEYLDTTCTVTYTVQAGDGANAVKSLTFDLTVTDANLATTWATPNIVVDIPVVRTFTTSFAATDCSFVRTSTGAGQCKQDAAPAAGCGMSKRASTPALR